MNRFQRRKSIPDFRTQRRNKKDQEESGMWDNLADNVGNHFPKMMVSTTQKLLKTHTELINECRR